MLIDDIHNNINDLSIKINEYKNYNNNLENENSKLLKIKEDYENQFVRFELKINDLQNNITILKQEIKLKDSQILSYQRSKNYKNENINISPPPPNINKPKSPIKTRPNTPEKENLEKEINIENINEKELLTEEQIILDDNYEILKLNKQKYILNTETNDLYEYMKPPIYKLNLLGKLKPFKVKSGVIYIINTINNEVFNFEDNIIGDLCGHIVNNKLKLN